MNGGLLHGASQWPVQLDGSEPTIIRVRLTRKNTSRATVVNTICRYRSEPTWAEAAGFGLCFRPRAVIGRVRPDLSHVAVRVRIGAPTAGAVALCRAAYVCLVSCTLNTVAR